jgi:hypothetical protein
MAKSLIRFGVRYGRSAAGVASAGAEVEVLEVMRPNSEGVSLANPQKWPEGC